MRCANPECQAETLYFRSGSLYWVDNPQQSTGVQFCRATLLIWLCAQCSRKLVVETWRPVGQQLRRVGGEVIAIDRDRAKPSVAAKASHPVSQSA